MKKILSTFFLCALVSSTLVVSGYASQQSITTDTNSLISYESSSNEIITEEVAKYYAEFFVRDFQSVLGTKWTSNTKVNNVEILYNPDGGISAYCFRLTTDGDETGYVVIGAYLDSESRILEFSDEMNPLYDSIKGSDHDTIVYTGSLNYYKELENQQFEALDNSVVDRTNINDSLIPLELNYQSCRNAVHRNVITDPFSWASNNYGGTFTAVEWKNSFESSCRFRTTSNFSTIGTTHYYGHCGPTAITNLIEMVGNYRGISSLQNLTLNNAKKLFSTVAQYGMNNLYYFNSSDPTIAGTPEITAGSFAIGAFGQKNITVTVQAKSVNYNNVKEALDAYCPILLSLVNHSTYGDHFVAAYAYTKLQNQYGTTLSFTKVMDGWGNSGRYICLSDSGLNKMFRLSIVAIPS